MWAMLTKPAGADVLRFERVYPCPIERLWAALITPERISDWLIADAEVDPRAGGRFRLKFRNSAHVIEGEITRFEPPCVLEYTWPEAAARHDSLVLWHLKPVQAGTQLVLTHTLSAGGDTADFASGWHWHLDALASAADGVATPWREDEWRRLQAQYRARFLNVA